MAVNMKTEVKVGSIDISSTSFRKWTIKETFGDEVSTCIIEATNVILSEIPLLDAGLAVTVKRGLTTSTDQFVFDGLVYRVDKQGSTVFIHVQDKLMELIKASVTKSFDGIAFPSTEAKGSVQT